MTFLPSTSDDRQCSSIKSVSNISNSRLLCPAFPLLDLTSIQKKCQSQAKFFCFSLFGVQTDWRRRDFVLYIPSLPYKSTFILRFTSYFGLTASFQLTVYKYRQWSPPSRSLARAMREWKHNGWTEEKYDQTKPFLLLAATFWVCSPWKQKVEKNSLYLSIFLSPQGP